MKYKVRPLGAYEKLFWVMDQKSALHFAIAAEIEGQASVGAWRFALDTVQQRHPNLSVRIEGNKFDNAYLEQVSNYQIPLRVVTSGSGEDWNHELETEMVNRFNLRQAPLVRAVLIHQPGKSIFIFVSNHSIGDGMSVALIIRDILNVVAGKTIDYLPPICSLDELLKINIKAIPEQKQLGITISLDPKPRAAVKIERLLVSPEFTKELQSTTKSKNTTVHGALTAAFVLAGRRLSQEWQEQPVRILHPVSVRKMLELGDDYGLLFNSIIVPYDPDKGTSFWELARAAKESISITKSADWNKNMVKNVSDIFNGDMELGMVENILNQAFDHNLLLSNLTQITYDTNFGDLKLKALWGPMVLAANDGAQTVGAATTNGQLTLTLVSHKPKIRLLDMARNILVNACHGRELAQIG